MHFSMQHNWDGGPVPFAPVGTGPNATMNWLSPDGPNPYLLKAPAATICLGCHDGSSGAPDVYAWNSNAAAYPQGRSAGALNDPTYGPPYQPWKGHTLTSTATPPGWNPALIGASPTWYDPSGGLDCTSCHEAHGAVYSYRNLGPDALGPIADAARPSYVVGMINDPTVDVWIRVGDDYVAGTGSPAMFGTYYDQSNIFYNRNDAVVGTTRTSNRMDTFCATCHGEFHGGPGDVGIGALPLLLDGFIRHPTSQATIGASRYSRHSTNAWFVSGTTRVKVFSSFQDGGNFVDATPGCVSCHKAHGNQNPFGLIYLNRHSVFPNEEGGWAPGQVPNDRNGINNLCTQCHEQGDEIYGFSTSPTTPATSSRSVSEP
jgi:cytochrome c553